MQITRAGEYGVLGLISLAQRGPGQVVMIEAVSREQQIPRSFLAKIFQSLSRAGLVRSVRGLRGGFALAKPADQITTLDVIEAIEGRIVFQRCLEAPAQCPHQGGCPLCGLFEQAQTQVRDVFAQTTLAQLMHTYRPSPGPGPARRAPSRGRGSALPPPAPRRPARPPVRRAVPAATL